MLLGLLAGSLFGPDLASGTVAVDSVLAFGALMLLHVRSVEDFVVFSIHGYLLHLSS